MFNPGPVHGEPIKGIGDLAGMALSANQMAQRALEANAAGTFSMGGATGTDSVPPYEHNFKRFRICSCWKRKRHNALGGEANGCYWTCDAIEVLHWWDWKGPHDKDGHQAVDSPDSHWETIPQKPQDTRTPIWWVTQNSKCCCPPGSGDLRQVCFEGDPDNPAACSCCNDPPGPIVPSSDICQDVPESNWQGEVPPRYGIGDYVWCIFEYSSGYWQILDAQDEIIPFILYEPMIGCHSTAKAALLQYECCEGNGCDCGSNTPEGSCDACQPSTCPPPSSCDRKPVEARQARIIELYDPLGIVNVQFAKRGLDPCDINDLDCAIQCSVQNALDLTADIMSHTTPPTPTSTCVSVPKDISIDCETCELVVEYCDLCVQGVIPGSPEWNAYFCENMKQLLTIGLRLYTRELSEVLNRKRCCDSDMEAPVGTFGWAKWNSMRRRWEVMTYGCCPCDECPTSSRNSCPSGSVTGSCSSTCGGQASSCAWMNLKPGSGEHPMELKWKGSCATDNYPLCSYEGIVEGTYANTINAAVTGGVTGDVQGSVEGSCTCHCGSCSGHHGGSTACRVHGSVTGEVTGAVTGNATGTDTGAFTGTVKTHCKTAASRNKVIKIDLMKVLNIKPVEKPEEGEPDSP